MTVDAELPLLEREAELAALDRALEDAHWGDVASLRFLRFLGARLDDLPLLLAVAARPDEPGAPAELLALAADPAALVLRPRALSAGAAAELVRDVLAPDADPAFCA